MKSVLLTFTMLLLTSVVYAQSGDSRIFIQQSGQNLTLNINQAGQGNEVGELDDSVAFILNGSQQDIRINQLGSGNRLIGEMFGSNIEALLNFVGDNNLMTIRVNPEGLNSAESGRYIMNVTGSNNQFNMKVADNAVADNAVFEWDITGDYNMFDSTVNADNYTSNLIVFGNYNNFTITASGAAGHSLDINHTGDYTNFVISQTATLEANTIKLETSTSGTVGVPSTICIHQSDAGTTGC